MQERSVSTSEASQLRDVLRTRLSELTQRVQTIEAELRQPVDDDSEEQATGRENDEPAEALKRSAFEEIAMIEAALGRIENGIYGHCLSCGEPIGSERLRLVPAATRCMSCAGGTLDS